MTKMLRNTSFALALACAPLAFSSQSHAQCAGAKPDNSAQNKDHSSHPTADNQPNGKSDVQITAQIRRNIMADKGLSTYAHNVKIITQNGAVTLKGPVKSEDEKQRVFKATAAVVAPGQISNQLSVKP